jgi:hypothetical protein
MRECRMSSAKTRLATSFGLVSSVHGELALQFMVSLLLQLSNLLSL